MVLVQFHDPDLRRCLGPPKASFWILVSHYIQKSASQDKGEGLLNILMMVISKTVMNEKSIQSVRDAKKKGENQNKDFVKERIIKTEKSIHDVIKRNKLPLFRQKNSVVTSNSKLQVTSLKQDCSLFASLYVACKRENVILMSSFHTRTIRIHLRCHNMAEYVKQQNQNASKFFQNTQRFGTRSLT